MTIITDVTNPENVRKAVKHLNDAVKANAADLAKDENRVVMKAHQLGDESPYQNKMVPAFFTNETNTYLSDPKFAGKTALCIAGGGDIIIELVANGYETIFGVDINLPQLFVTILKLKTFEKLTIADFNSFWEASPKCFSYDVIKKVLVGDDIISVGTLSFGESIFEKYDWNSQKVRYYAIFGESNFIDNDSRRSVKPDYAKTSKLYRKAQKKISSGITIELICSDIAKYNPTIKMDFIHFSNIYNFMLPNDYIELVRRYVNNLTAKGKIVTYIIQLDKSWILAETPKIYYNQVQTNGQHIQMGDNGKFMLVQEVPDIIEQALWQQLGQAREVYRKLKRYNVSLIEVKTGKGYSGFYKTIKDLVLVVTV